MAATRFGSPPGPFGWIGTLAEQAELTGIGESSEGAQYLVTDQPGSVYERMGGAWVQTHSGGRLFVLDQSTKPADRLYRQTFVFDNGAQESFNTGDLSGYKSVMVIVDVAAVGLGGDTITCKAAYDDDATILSHSLGLMKINDNGSTSNIPDIVQSMTAGTYVWQPGVPLCGKSLTFSKVGILAVGDITVYVIARY